MWNDNLKQNSPFINNCIASISTPGDVKTIISYRLIRRFVIKIATSSYMIMKQIGVRLAHIYYICLSLVLTAVH